MFFGAGTGVGPFANGFGGAPVFTFGNGGFRVHTHTTRNARAEPAEARSTFVQLLPLIILLVLSFLSSMPSLFTSSPPPDPHFSFTSTNRFSVERRTAGLGVKYHVNGPEFSAHPQIAADLASLSAGKRGAALSRFEGTVERTYTQDLYVQCQKGLDRRERKRDAEIGLFGIGTNWEKVKEIEKEIVDSCEELKRLGILRA